MRLTLLADCRVVHKCRDCGVKIRPLTPLLRPKSKIAWRKLLRLYLTGTTVQRDRADELRKLIHVLRQPNHSTIKLNFKHVAASSRRHSLYNTDTASRMTC